MKSYTEEEVRSLIDENLKLIKELTQTQESLEEETRLRKSAEQSYRVLCERCMNLYLTDRDITTDTLFVQVNVPRFMNPSDLANGNILLLPLVVLKVYRGTTVMAVHCDLSVFSIG